MSFAELGAHRVENDPDYNERLATYYAKTKLEMIFACGAAVSSQGVVTFPFPTVDRSYSLSPTQEVRFYAGEIIEVNPAQINADKQANPMRVFLIPPGSLERLAVLNIKGKQRSHSIVLVRGYNEDGDAITQSITSLPLELLMQGLRAETIRAIEKKGIDVHGKNFSSPTTIAKKALFQMAHDFGLRNLSNQQ